MKERPILFKGRLVRAILEGHKTQTRRVIKRQPFATPTQPEEVNVEVGKTEVRIEVDVGRCPYGEPGDQLWVREAWRQKFCTKHDGENSIPTNPCECGGAYAADSPDPKLSIFKWKPSIHMPRWASRIQIAVVSVKVERVQEITVKDACAEGVFHGGYYATEPPMPYPIATFKRLWDTINRKRGFGWESNPYVWVVEFKRIR